MIEITTWKWCCAGLSHFTHPNSNHQPIYLSQCSQIIMRSLHWFQMEGGARGLWFHQVGSLLNGHCSLNVPMKGSEVPILLDNLFLCEHCMNPGVFPLVVSISLTPLLSLSVCLSPSSNQSYYTLTVRVLLCGTWLFNTLHFLSVSEVPLQSKMWLVYEVGAEEMETFKIIY